MAVALECNAKLQTKRDNEKIVLLALAQLSYTIDLRQGYRWIDLDPANHPDHLENK